jgi:hypothetical protein
METRADMGDCAKEWQGGTVLQKGCGVWHADLRICHALKQIAA